MSSTFKWIVLKSATILGRSVPSLFYQLIHREIYREIFDLSNDGKKTVQDAYKLGYVASLESAERQSSVFRFFPSEPLKVLEYVPLLWNIYFGAPMQDYTTKWDYTDPKRPILTYRTYVDPMTFGLGDDEEFDNLPWKKFWDNDNGYGSLMAGLLTQVTSHVLKVKGKKERITLKNSSSPLHGDPYFEFKCQIFQSEEELPDFSLEYSKEYIEKANKKSISSNLNSQQNDIWTKITENIDIDKLDDIIESPSGLFRIIISNGLEKLTKMSSKDFIDHFTGDEEKFIQVLGFLNVHSYNELGQIPETFFNNKTFAKIYGHLFKFFKENANKFIPFSVIANLKDFMCEVFAGIAPEVFVDNLKKIPTEKVVDLYFEGMEKALMDIGVDFHSLRDSLYEEFRSPKPSDENKYTVAENEKREKIVSKIVNEMMIISTSLLTLPSQIAIIVAYNTISSSSNRLSSLFKTVRESIQKIMDFSDKLKEFN